jgi:O-antigen/teichoic acid export membrane protein
MATYSAVLRGLEQFSVVARVENIYSLGMYAACIAVLVWTQHLALALTVFPSVEYLKFLLFRRYLHSHYLNLSHLNTPHTTGEKAGNIKQWRDVGSMMREQFPFVFLQGISIVESRAGMFALGFLALAQSEVGYFGGAMRFVIALRTFSGAMFSVVLPSFAKNDSPEAENTVTKITLLRQALLGGGVVALLGSIFLFILAEPLISLIYGAKLLPAVPILRVVAPLFFLQTLANILEAYLLAHKQEHFVNIAMGSLVAIFFAGMSAAQAIVAGGVGGEIVSWGSLCLSAALLGIYTLKTRRIVQQS